MLTNEESNKKQKTLQDILEPARTAQEKLIQVISISYTLEQALSHVHDSGEKNPPIYEFIVLLGMQKELLSALLQASDDVMREVNDGNLIFEKQKRA